MSSVYVICVLNIVVQIEIICGSCLFFYFFPPSLSRAVGPVIMSIEEKMEADGRSIYVGNVSTFRIGG